VVGEGIDWCQVSGQDGFDGIADGPGDVLDVRDAVHLGDDVAAFGDSGFVNGDRAVDAVLGGHLLASLKQKIKVFMKDIDGTDCTFYFLVNKG
jgi:hypothetical protein